MTAPYLGGIEITRVAELAGGQLLVQFESVYEDQYLYQVYLGRMLAGVSSSPWSRVVVVADLGSDWPEHLTLLAVDPSEALTDYGSQLPTRPYNRVKLTIDTSALEAGTKFVEVAAGTEPEGAVDPENVLVREIFRGGGTLSLLTDPLAGGTWNFEIAGRDGTAPDGNRGEALELAATITAHPPDVEGDEDGRFDYSVAAGVLTVNWTNGEV